MKLIAPDFTRRIDLPGVGPCPRPVDIDQSLTGFDRLVSLRIYTFADGTTIDGEAEDDEVYIVLLSGAATIAASGAHAASFTLSETGERAIYLPPDHHYHLEPRGETSIAYMRAKPGRALPPAGFSAREGREILPNPGHADRLKLRLVALTPDTQISVGSDTEEQLAFVSVRFTAGGTTHDAWTTLALAPGERAEIAAAEAGFMLVAGA